MKICIDINSTLKSSSTGIGRLTIALVEALASLSWPEGHRLLLCYRKRFFDFKKKCPRIKSKSVEYFNSYRKDLPKADIYIALSYKFKFPSYGKNILIVHDLIPLIKPEFSSDDAKNILLNSLPGLIKDVDRIICISQNTRNDLLRFYSYAKDKAEVIYPSTDPSFKKVINQDILKADLKKIGVKGEYILFVSSIEPRKNLISLLKAFPDIKKKFPHIKIVVAGKSIVSYKGVDEYLKTYEFKDDIILLGYVDDKNLISLYSGASVFVFPSFYEGFGLPILEAFSCGTPVVTSDTSSMKEIAHDCAELVDPYNIKSIAAGIERLLTDNDYRRKLVENGFKKAQEFSLKNTAEKYFNLFREVLAD